jgi:PAS domain S-box-containing protein
VSGNGEPGRGEPAAAGANAYLQAALDCVVMVDGAGRVVEFNPAAERVFGYRRDEALGRVLSELIVPPSLRARHEQAFARFAATGEQRLFGRPLELTGMRADGSEFPVELALSRVAGEPLLVCGAIRDLSAAKRAERELRELAEEQAALRRVATLVAREALTTEVFAAVAEEVARVLGVPLVQMSRYESAGAVTVIATWGEQPFAPGSTWPLDGPTLSARVLATGRPARIDSYDDVPGAIGDAIRAAGIRSGVGVPIVAGGALWGVMMALSTQPEPLPPGTEARLGDFTELVATAIANTEAREVLRGLAEEQDALRRVATLVARRAAPDEVFAAVAEQVAKLLDVPAISMVRFEPDGTSTAIAVWGAENPFGTGTRFEPHPGVMLQVRRTRRPARLEDFAGSTGPTTARLQAAGIESGVGVPILVDDDVWGTVIALTTRGRRLPEGIEPRLASFSELVATAIANLQARDDLRSLAEEQAALRRVATLVAGGAEPEAVFDAVCEEAGTLIGATSTNLAHFTADGYSLATAGWSVRDTHVPSGTRLPLEGETIDTLVQRTGAPARVDSYEHTAGDLAALLRARGIRAEVGAPVLVDGRAWGALIAGWDSDEPPPPGIELRVARFAGLIATAIANAQSRSELDQLAREQAALRRVATLVARRARPDEVFAAVAEEVGKVLDVEVADLWSYGEDGAAEYQASWTNGPPLAFPQRLALDGLSVARLVRDTARPARIDDYAAAHEREPGAVGEAWRRLGIRAAVGCPVVVDGLVWGVMSVCRLEGEPLPDDAEERLASFTELIATAIANATTYAELVASRARIVAAADEGRRRIERDLHDGVQQQLISAGLDLQALRSRVPESLGSVQGELEQLEAKLTSVFDDVREISRGLHPALLAQAGLASALKSLARRSAVPAELELSLAARLPDAVEMATYFVVSEALANAAKHSGATLVRVRVDAADGSLRASVEDDGRGGAVASAGSGLLGLSDRVEALGGRFRLESRSGAGTTISIELPLGAS